MTDGAVALRAHRLDDVPRVVEQCRDPLSQAWTTVPVPYAETDAVGFVAHVVPAGWATGTEWAFALEVDGRFGGTISLRPIGADRAEIGFGAHPDVRGTGAVERGVRLLLAWGLETQGLRTVVWRADRGNWASRRLAWRVGFSFDGTVRGYLPQRGELIDGWVGTLLAGEPREPRSPWLANPPVEGARVRLRPFRPEDAARVVEGLGDERTQHWLAFVPRSPGLADAERYLEQVTERLATAHTVTWAVADAGDDRLLGAVGIYRLAEEPELGYWTHPEARRRRLTVEAGALALDHAFGALSLPRVAAYVASPHRASRRVLEHLGFAPTGTRRAAARTGDGSVVDLAGYDLLATDWPASDDALRPSVR
nr:GNAT family N-acetyltransferase [Nocardioides flavescens]